MTRVCGYRWSGPRADVEDVIVTHVCGLVPGHIGLHRCTCGAVVAQEVGTGMGTSPPLDPPVPRFRQSP